MYKVHKWIAVVVGVFFLVWLISGIVMILPPLFPGPPRQQNPAALDFREVTVSPAQAVGNLAKSLGSYPEVNRVTLRRIGDALAYEVSVESGISHLIDARSGEVFTITPEIAEQIARDKLPSQGRVLQIERVDRATPTSGDRFRCTGSCLTKTSQRPTTSPPMMGRSGAVIAGAGSRKLWKVFTRSSRSSSSPGGTRSERAYSSC